MQTSVPIEKRVVLLGAGNAHVQVVNWWRMQPVPGVQLSLVNNTLTVPYSGMLPGCIAGQYSEEEITIDVGRLCAAAAVELVPATASSIDPAKRQLHLEGRPPLSYDILSLNVGSRPLVPKHRLPDDKALSLKPLHTLLDRIGEAEKRLRAMDGPVRVVLVGSGAGGFEIGLALHRRWAGLGSVSLEILGAGDRVLPASPRALSRLAERVLRERGVGFRAGARVVGGDDGALHLESGETVACDLCVWATAATPLDILARSGLERDERGFLRAHATLQSVSVPEIFAAGDCVSLVSAPELPRAGIFSVREGPILWENLRSAVAGRPPRSYRPQSLYLFLLNTADGRAIMRYGHVAARGRWAFRWKNRIDRRWMRNFHQAYAAPKHDPLLPGPSP